LKGADNVRFDNASIDIVPVGKLRANGFGLHDVHGNVWEWCGDTYDATADPRTGDGLRDDGVDSSVFRVLRGALWSYSPDLARSAYRTGGTPENRADDIGLRPSRGITP
jgi:formylglycine-generating enzyme required for sulfatase activity